jgi:hypothetical protein
MWATIKNYAIIPSKGGGGRNGVSPVIDELPFCTSFTVYDRKQLLKRSSKSQMSKAARRKLMLALTEDPDCFAYLQSKLRARNSYTHQTVAELLHNDTAMLEELSSRVMDNGVTLSKQQQLQHGIISSKTAAAHSKLNGDGGMTLLNNIKGLIIQEEDISEDERSDPYGYTSFTRSNASSNKETSYVVVSTPHQQNNHSYHHNHNTRSHTNNGKRGSLIHYLSSRDIKLGSWETVMGSGGKQRGGAARGSAINDSTGSCHVATSNALPEFYDSSASLMESFGDSQELPVPGESCSNNNKRMCGAGLKAALNFNRARGNGPRGDRRGSSETPSSAKFKITNNTNAKIMDMDSAQQLQSVSLPFGDLKQEPEYQVADAREYDDSADPGCGTMPTLAQRRQMKMMKVDATPVVAAIAAIGGGVTESGFEEDEDDQSSMLLVEFPTKARIIPRAS